MTARLLDQMKEDARAIFNAGVSAVDPGHCIRQACTLENDVLNVANRAFDLKSFDKIMVLGAGKASAAIAAALEDILKDRIDSGIIITKYGHQVPLKKIKVFEAGHPIPDENGIIAAEKLLALAHTADKTTLVIFLVSGGGSALTPLPVPGISLDDKQKTTTALLHCGAAIHEINAIRKHLSQIKGGLLAKALAPATMVGLVISDVVGDDLSAIASGPAVPDPTTFEDCRDIIKKHQIDTTLPPVVTTYFKKGAKDLAPETLKPGDPIFNTMFHQIIADNITSLKAAQKKAEFLGYNSLILSSMIEGDTEQAAKFHTAMAKQIHATGHPVKSPACIITGGETTVTVKGKGLGGRNQQFALACAEEIAGLETTVILSCGTDGTDGPTNAAGAIADHQTLARAKAAGLDPDAHLLNNDAYPFFNQLNDLVITGPTRTNVMDIRLILVR